MANTTITVGPDVEHYRQAERALWSHHGLEPTERFVELDSPAVRLRLLEVGSGEPVLFVHGTVGPAWPSLVRELNGFRSLILDRPGWGLSSPLDFSKYQYQAVERTSCAASSTLSVSSEPTRRRLDRQRLGASAG